jgi:HAD superfamily hydrolase (TIGR01509 family)
MVTLIKGVTFDFYQTLVRGRFGERGRGQRFVDYLTAKGLTSDPWEHRVLYDVFENFGEEYDPSWAEREKDRYWVSFTVRVFARTNTLGETARLPKLHAHAIRDIFGPCHFELFPDVLPALQELRRHGFPLAIISNWQKGLHHFCSELGIGEYFQAIISSAEVDLEKPDPQIFHEASRLLGNETASMLHVGDQLIDDVQGAEEAGFFSVWLRRDQESCRGRQIPSLVHLTRVIERLNDHGADSDARGA